MSRRWSASSIALAGDYIRMPYARASQQEQESSLANSSLLNDAYRTLKDPIKRTEYLLKLEGILSRDEGGRQERGPRSARPAGGSFRIEYAARRDADESQDGRR